VPTLRVFQKSNRNPIAPQRFTLSKQKAHKDEGALDLDQTGGINIKRRGVEMLGIALKCRVKIKKVREDFAEPKQMVLFETPNQPELTF